MRQKVQFGIVVELGGGDGIYIKPRGSTLGEWQVKSGLMFYPMAGWQIRQMQLGVIEYDPFTGCWPSEACEEDGTVKQEYMDYVHEHWDEIMERARKVHDQVR
jgi:hypothetical protein